MTRETARGDKIDDPAVEGKPTPTDERLADGQKRDHWVLDQAARAKGYIRPIRYEYTHDKCGTDTTMPAACAETYAADPQYYGSTFCVHCGDYFPVGADGEFTWTGSKEKVGT